MTFRPPARTRASWTPRQPGTMNETEQAYAQHLDARKAAGEVAAYWFEGIRIKLPGERMFYTPDFFVLLADGFLELHEVKGYWEDTAKMRMKLAAQAYPFRCIAVRKRSRKDGGGFEEEEF